MKTRTAKILRDTWGVRANQTRMESSDGSISTKKTTSNGLRADHDLSGSRSNTVDSGVADAGLMQNGFAADAGTSHGKHTSITTMPRSATLDGMRLDSIPQVRPVTPDLPPAATEVMA